MRQRIKKYRGVGPIIVGGWVQNYPVLTGDELRMVFCDHYRASRYFGYRFYDETEVKEY